jgi:hypothetical protein
MISSTTNNNNMNAVDIQFRSSPFGSKGQDFSKLTENRKVGDSTLASFWYLMCGHVIYCSQACQKANSGIGIKRLVVAMWLRDEPTTGQPTANTNLSMHQRNYNQLI